MKHHLIVTYDDNGKPMDVTILHGSPVIVPHAFDTSQQAKEYQQQLFTTFGLRKTPDTARKGPLGPRKSVRCEMTQEVFSSAAAAGRSIGVSASAIKKYLNNPTQKNAPKGFTWSYV